MKAAHFKLASLTLWLALLGVAIFSSPPASPDTNAVIARMMKGQLEGLNLSLFGLFNLMGVWPAALAVALRFDRSRWKWLFIVLSFALGAFALLPWFVLRPWGAPRVQPTSLLGRLLSSRWLMLALGLGAVVFAGLFLFGDLAGFATLFATQQFPYVMSFDFLATCLAAGLLGLERRMLVTPR